VVSEGVAAIGAPALHALGIDGAGLRVGIIDQGFAGLGNLLGNEIPADTRARSFYGSPSGDGDLTGAGTAHGTTCAEIVHDVAPGAQLFLANALTPIEFQAAVRWMRDQGVAVISHSIGWFEGGGDGTGPIHDIVNEALDAGILWVNAAGNEARSYWGGPFIDSDGNGLHEFDAAGDETITHTIGDGGRGFTLVLTWDRWPYSTDLAFDIEIYENGDLAASSETLYEPRYAYRALAHARSLGKRLDIAIRRTLGDEPAHLRLFRLDSSDPIGEHGTAEGSLLVPADGARVLAVGAYRVTDGRLEEFSSRGPTVDGIAKPEVCAPDFVSTATDSPFVGTSAAAPHAAGVAALLLQTAPQAGFFDFRWSAGELRQWMSTAAAPDTFADPNAAAWGLLRAPDFAEPTNAAGRYPLEFISPTRLPLAARCMQASNAPWTLEIFDPAGRRLLAHSFPRIDPAALIQLWDGSRGGAARIGNGCYLLRARGAGWSKTQPIVVLR
jgi:subtilisin family serine protease